MDVKDFKKMLEKKGITDKIKTPTPQNITQECYKPSSEPKEEPKNLNAYAQKPRTSKKRKEQIKRERSNRTKLISVRLLKENFIFLKGKCRSEIINNLITKERTKEQSRENELGYWKKVLEGKEELSV